MLFAFGTQVCESLAGGILFYIAASCYNFNVEANSRIQPEEELPVWDDPGRGTRESGTEPLGKNRGETTSHRSRIR